MSINNAPLGDSNHSPFYLNYGFHPTMPVDLRYIRSSAIEPQTETVKEFVTRMNQLQDFVSEFLRNNSDRMYC